MRIPGGFSGDDERGSSLERSSWRNDDALTMSRRPVRFLAEVQCPEVTGLGRSWVSTVCPCERDNSQ